MKTPLTLLTCILSIGCISQAQAKHLLVSEKAMATNNVSVSQTLNSNSRHMPKEKSLKPATVQKPAVQTSTRTKSKNTATTLTTPYSISFTPHAAMTSLYDYGQQQMQQTTHT